LDAKKIIQQPCHETPMERKTLAAHIPYKGIAATWLIGHLEI
jgi:hypothetical protein